VLARTIRFDGQYGNTLNIELRSATPADQRSITRLIFQNQLNGLGIGWKSFTVAENEHGEFLGCGQIKQHGDIDELASLVVEGKWQGHGVSNVLMDALMKRGRRPLWLMCESPLTTFYTRYHFREVKKPDQLPSYFRTIYWLARLALGAVFFMRGTYVAFMVLDNDDTRHKK
jgi:N-acetylglutamate synthase-like GNAT family acetyltransferase